MAKNKDQGQQEPAVLVNVSTLRSWLETLQNGANPSVRYRNNWVAMTKEAMQTAQDACSVVANSIEALGIE